MGKYISAIDSTWDMTISLDWCINFFWQVRVNSVQDMVTKILNYVGNDKISNLVIIGHGQPGLQSVGCGENPDSAMQKYLHVDSSTAKLVGDGEHYMSLLKPKLEPTAIVSLTGCGAGSGTDGDTLLKRLATILGVKVEGAISKEQRVIPGYEGDVKRCDSTSCSVIPASIFY